VDIRSLHARDVLAHDLVIYLDGDVQRTPVESQRPSANVEPPRVWLSWAGFVERADDLWWLDEEGRESHGRAEYHEAVVSSAS
jgi:hypothetical protein